MATLQQTIEIILSATDNTAATFNSLTKSLNSVESGIQNIQKVSTPLANITEKFLMMEGAVVALGVAFGVHAFKESAKFEASQLDLQKVLGDNEGLAADYTAQVDKLSLTFGISGATILQSAADFKQAGYNISDAFLLTEAALTATRVSELELGEASSLLVGILKGFHAPATEVTHLLDSMNEVSNKYATSMGELAIGMAEVAPAASLMGFSFEQTEAMLTPMIEIFRSGAEAGTALKMGLTNIISDAKPVQDALQALGVTQKDANGHLRSGVDIMSDIAVAFQTANEQDKLFLATQLVGDRQAVRLIEVFNGYAKTLEITKIATDSAGSATKELAVRLQAAEIEADKMKVGFEIISRTIGDQFKVELTDIIKNVTSLELAFSEIVKGGGFEPLMKLIRPQLEEWGELIDGMAKALPEAMKKVDWTPILFALGGLKDSFAGIFEGLDLTKPDDLAKAINKVIEVAASMITTTQGIFDIFIKVGGVIADMIGWYSSLSPEMQKLAGYTLGAATAFTVFAPALLLAIDALQLLLAPAALGGLISILSGPIGITAVISLATYEIYKLIQGLMEWGIAAQNLKEIQQDAAEQFDHSTKNSAEQLKKLGIVNDDIRESFNQFNAEVKAGTIVWNEQTKEWERSAGQLKTLDSETDKLTATAENLAEAVKKYGSNFEVVNGQIVPLKENTDSLAAATRGVTDAVGEEVYTYEKINGVWMQTVVNTGKLSDANEKAAKKIEATVKELFDYQVAWEKIQSEERIALFELQTKVNIAEIESQTKIIESMFESIDTAINSTEDLLGDLFGNMDEAARVPFGMSTLLDAIEQELDLRKQTFGLQQSLIEAEIALIEQKTAAMARGDAMISIQADGMEPQIEAFMWEILKRIQVRANAEGQEFLLGVA